MVIYSTAAIFSEVFLKDIFVCGGKARIFGWCRLPPMKSLISLSDDKKALLAKNDKENNPFVSKRLNL